EMREQGALYLSRKRHEGTSARFVTGRLVPGQSEERAERKWRRLVRELRAPGPQRRVYSSEFLSDATDEQVARIVEEVGVEDLYVACTLRPLASILPSQYQQYVQRGSTRSYGAWLDAMFTHPAGQDTPSFWLRHPHDELVERWGSVVGHDRVIVVVVDSRDFTVAPRAFEQLLGLDDGTLVDKQVTANRSLTWGETEVVRKFNRQFRDAGLPDRLQLTLMHEAGDHVKARVPGPDEAKILTPEWAIKRANEVGAEMTEAIIRSGARIVGDASLLTSAPVKPGPTEPPTEIPVDIAARFAAGFALGADRIQRQAEAGLRDARAAARKAQRAARRRAAVPPPARRSLPRRVAGKARRALARLRSR
ncbi:MAG: hypothetical protein ACTHKG_19575, partial [Nocardioides sp.]